MYAGRLDRDGYPQSRAHRRACARRHGPPPFPRAEALHSCDNNACVAEEHLRWGTRAENVAEQFARGRHRNFRPHGKPYVCGACGGLGHNVRTCDVRP